MGTAKIRKTAPPLGLKQARKLAQVCLDMHEALGIRWGDDPYARIRELVSLLSRSKTKSQVKSSPTKAATCTAIVRGDRIELVIDNGEKGAKAFAHVLKLVTDHGLATWRGDIIDAEGRDGIGYIITHRK